MDNVVPLSTITTLDVPVEKVVAGASEASLKEVVIIGLREDGENFLAASSGNAANILWLLECAKKTLMDRT